ncbi:type II toxin-antitoxin system antitoxin SocA domain-containing protein [Yersinia enterocolitica]
MAYSAIAVANSFIEKSKLRDISDLSPMKLQKLVYFAHAWMLALTDKPLINEPVKAWQYGPVINSVYHEFKNFGSQNITNLGTEFEGIDSDNIFDMKYVIPRIPKDDNQSNQIIDAVLDTYGNKSATFLSNLTHEPGSAWCETQHEHNKGHARGYVIDNEIIKKSMKSKLGV